MDIKEIIITKIADTFSDIIAPSTFERISFLGLGKALKDSKERKRVENQQKEDEELINLLVDEYTDKKEQEIVRVILQNQLTYWYTSQQNRNSLSKQLLLALTAHVIRYILNARELVGIQPLIHSVGYTYTIVFKERDDGTMLLEIVSNVTEAVSRKLQTGWTIELSQDILGLQGTQFESDLIAAVADEIGHELVAEIINDLSKLAQQNEIIKVDDEQYLTDSFNNLILTINRAANDIAVTTKRGCGNFIVTSPIGIALLQSAKFSGYQYVPVQSTKSPDLFSVVHVGYLTTSNDPDGSGFKVYSSLVDGITSPVETESLELGKSYFLVGYKGGSGETDTGYIYSPYTPIMLGSITINPTTYQPILPFTTRYGKTIRYESDKWADSSKSQNYYRLIEFNTATTCNSSKSEDNNVENS